MNILQNRIRVLYLGVLLLIGIILYCFGLRLSKELLQFITGIEYQISENSHCFQMCGLQILLDCIIISLLVKNDVFKKSVYSFRPVKLRTCLILMLAVMLMELPNSLLVNWLLPGQTMNKGIIHIASNAFGYINIVFIGPIMEELIFRGTILGLMLKKRWNPYIAIALSALLFGIAHMNIQQGVHATITGLLIGYLFYKTHSIWPGIVIHIFGNYSAMSHISDKMERTELPISYPLQITIFVVAILLSYGLWKVACTYGKKERKFQLSDFRKRKFNN